MTKLTGVAENMVSALRNKGFEVISEDFEELYLSIRRDGEILDVKIDFDEKGYTVNYLKNEEPTAERTITLDKTIKFIEYLI